MKKVLLPAVASLLILGANAQTWTQMIQDPHANFYNVQKAFNTWEDAQQKRQVQSHEPAKEIETNDNEAEMPGYALFKRWEYFMAPRVYPTGKPFDPTIAYKEYQKYLQQQNTQRTQATPAWKLLGPVNAIPSNGGAGRVNTVRFNPLNPKTMYIGAPDGGLWKSYNGGASWSTNTDQLAVIGVSDLVFAPGDTNVMYIATGDGDHSDSYSIGILKSKDNGKTWYTTGLSFAVSSGITIRRLIIDPTNAKVLYAASTNGIYKSTDSAATWTNVQSGNFKDIAFMPGNTAIVYGATSNGQFWRSTNSGATWTQIVSGLPGSGAGRMAIGVSPADSAIVYVLAEDNSNSGFYGFYVSSDKGANFTNVPTSLNLLGWSSKGTDVGGQGWYDLSIAVNPKNASEVIVGGVNIWRTTNGGSSWALNAQWTGTGAPYVHADIHCLTYLLDGSAYYAGCDGGCFTTNTSGASWNDLSNGLQIAQSYKLGVSGLTPAMVISGWQDNGTNLVNGGTWTQVIGGDGMDCFIDKTNDNYMYGEYYNGNLQMSSNGGASFSSISSGITEGGAWVTPWVQDPSVSSTIYAGFINVWKSTNRGGSWTKLNNPSSNGNQLTAIAVAPSNNQYIYSASYNQICRTANGGTSWTDITGTLPVGSSSITFITVNANYPDSVWVTFSGYNASNKVFVTPNGGTTWVNMSTGLPNLPVNCSVFQKGTNEGIYVGTDIGVYYRDNTTGGWISYMNGLPDVRVDELQLDYISGNVVAATFGRAIWECATYVPTDAPPYANFAATPVTVCAGMPLNFTDQSISGSAITSWKWSFTGGTPSSSSLQNPTITYNTPGTYAVSLKVTNPYGADSITKTAYITVLSSTPNPLPLVQGFEGSFPPGQWTVNNPNGHVTTWALYTGVGGFGKSSKCMYYNNCTGGNTGQYDQIFTPNYDFSSNSNPKMYFDVAYTPYNNTYSDTLAVYYSTDCGTTFNQIYLEGGLTLCTTGGVTVQGGAHSSGGCFVPLSTNWRTDTISIPAIAGQSSVMFSFENRSGNGTNLFVDNINIPGVPTGTPVLVNEDMAMNVYPNPSNGNFTISFSAQAGKTYDMAAYNLLGQQVVHATIQHASGNYTYPVDLSQFGKGIYTVMLKDGSQQVVKKVAVF